jgi:hypothetical protein
LILPLDHTAMTFTKFFVVLTCIFYWVHRGLRRALRSQQPWYYRHDDRDT